MKTQSDSRVTALLSLTSTLHGHGWLKLGRGRFTSENDQVTIV